MYRRNLAAFWTAQSGELKADECIEDIFAGGDGWAKHDDPNHPSATRNTTAAASAGAARGAHNHKNPRTHRSPKRRHHHQPRVFNPPSSSSVSGRASLEQHASNMAAEAEASQDNSNFEVDEFEIRDDLKSWKVPENPERIDARARAKLHE